MYIGFKCEPTQTPAADIPALKDKYRREREKRLRPEGVGQYVEIAGDLADQYESDPYTPPVVRDPISEEFDVAILGGGFAGLMAGGYLKRAGVTDLRIIDVAGDFGGAWYWNRYPGVQCDVESYTYLPMLEETNYIPKDRYSYGPEIFEHCQRIGKHFGLYDKALFGTAIRDMHWDEGLKRWRIRTRLGDDLRPRFIVMACGPLNKPKLPGIPGILDFKGHTFHTARWDYDYTGGDTFGGLTKLADKRVAIIGTGATAIQCIPFLGEYAKHLTVFQRTPSYIHERGNRPTDPEWAKTLKPGWQAVRQYAYHNGSANGMLGPGQEDLICDGWTEINRNLRARLDASGNPSPPPADMNRMREEEEFKMTERIRQRIEDIVTNKKTAEALKPWFRFRCKRPCFNDEYLPTFNRPNVTLVDVSDSKGVERITKKGIVANGVEHEVDCIIYASGFEVTTDFKRRYGIDAIAGRGGVSLYDYWADGYRTMHGMMACGFPNQFYTGYVQGAVVGSITLMYEHQARHISHIIREALARGVTSVEPSPEGQDAWLKLLRDTSLYNPAFQQECTPSYFNGEGTDASRSPLFGDLFGPGYEALERLLKDWRDKGDLAGLVIEK